MEESSFTGEASDSEALDSSAVSSDSDSASSTATPKNKKKKGSLHRKPNVEVGRILNKLVDDDVCIMVNKAKGTKTKDRNFFCIEDVFLTKDLKIHVEGVGQLSFPLEKHFIEQMIALSSKAKFGKGRETLLDTKVRDTQMIPANKLKIEIRDTSLDDLLKRISAGLNISKNSQLIPHLHNLLIYGPGQFFKKHTDSEKIENMIATLVIILPYPHEGGELIIEHNKNKHMFFGSKNPDVAKCVAFYSDCAHEIKKIKAGYRVAITYNVVLQPPDIPDVAVISESLDLAVDNYFKTGKTKLAFGLNHSYSKNSLKWNLLKGADRPRVNALLAVAKKQGRIPCLALTSYHEIYDRENTYYCPSESPVLVDEETTVDFMIDENYSEIKFCTFEDSIDNNKEFCCTKKAKELFKPYETAASGPTGNEGDTEEYWYRRACLVLWSNKWVFTHGFKEALNELHHLTKQDGMRKVLIEKISEARKDFAQPEIWAEPDITEILLDIVIYLGDEEEAKFILGDLSNYLLQEDHVSRLVELEKKLTDQTWCDIVKIWKDNDCFGGWKDVVSNANKFINKYLELVGVPCQSVVIDAVLEDAVKKFVDSKECKIFSKYVNNKKVKESIETLRWLMKICSILEKKSLQETLINHVVSSSYPAEILGELYTKLMDEINPENLTSYEIIRDLAENSIDSCLSKLNNETGWTFPVEVTCNCKICSPVKKFFLSRTLISHVVEGTKKTCDHLLDEFFDLLDLPKCKISVDNGGRKSGRKPKITFEKLPQLQKDRVELNGILVKYREKIKSPKSVEFINVKVENEDNYEENSVLEDFSSIDITENIKDELQDGIDDNFGPFQSVEKVSVKSEATEHVDESGCEEEIPKKRQRKTKHIS